PLVAQRQNCKARADRACGWPTVRRASCAWNIDARATCRPSWAPKARRPRKLARATMHRLSSIFGAPAVVLLLGIAVAAAIGAVGLSNLRLESDRQAGSRALLLAATLAARMAPLSMDERRETMQAAARKTGAELLLMTSE